jgi:hypothetical protein
MTAPDLELTTRRERLRWRVSLHPVQMAAHVYKVPESQLDTKFFQQFSFSPLRNFQSHVIFRYLLKKGRLIAANRNTYRTNAMPAARRLGLQVGVV